MPKSYDKRYGTDEEGVLSGVIERLESERASNHRGALFALLVRGPLFCEPSIFGDAFDRFWMEDGTAVRKELLDFLHSIVSEKGQGFFSGPLDTYGTMSFSINLSTDNRVSCGASGSPRDIIVLQLVTLLQVVGLANVRVCSVNDCDRLFVKTHRREYCSSRCQKRAYMRERRRQAADQAKGKRRAKLRRLRAKTE